MADQQPFNAVRMLLIDNYDSFTYNLVQAFAAHGAEVMVHRNDAIGADEALALAPTHLVISPGPGRPESAGFEPARQAVRSPPEPPPDRRPRRSAEPRSPCWPV